MSHLLELLPPPTECKLYGCCLNSHCPSPLSCNSCFYREKIKSEMSLLLNTLIVELTGLYSYKDLIMNDPYICIQTKINTALHAIQNMTKRGIRKRPALPTHLNRRPNFLGNNQPPPPLYRLIFQESNPLDFSHDACSFHTIREKIKKALQRLLSDVITSSQTALLLYSNSNLAFLKQIQEEIDAEKSNPNDSDSGNAVTI